MPGSSSILSTNLKTSIEAETCKKNNTNVIIINRQLLNFFQMSEGNIYFIFTNTGSVRFLNGTRFDIYSDRIEINSETGIFRTSIDGSSTRRGLRNVGNEPIFNFYITILVNNRMFNNLLFRRIRRRNIAGLTTSIYSQDQNIVNELYNYLRQFNPNTLSIQFF
jgi:hypothetical protein